MCGRYVLAMDRIPESIVQLIDVCNRRSENDREIIIPSPSGEIFPDSRAPALFEEGSHITARAMRWGFEPVKHGLIINARTEDLRKRPMFAPLLEKRRCILPAVGYYEWRSRDHLRYLIHHKDSDPFYLSGLYRQNEQGELRFVVLTRPAYALHQTVHDRMPCMLFSRQDASDWLHGRLSPEEFMQSTNEPLVIDPQGPEQLSLSDFLEI